MSRAKAFRAIRDHIGPEICPLLRESKRQMPKEREKLNRAGYTTDLMRSALAGALVLLTEPERTKCPNCEQPLDDHNPKCIVKKLLDDTRSGSSVG